MSDPIHKAGFDHPCRETCSGWQQGYDRGYERGLEHFKKSQQDLVSERDELKKENEQLKKRVADLETSK